MVRYKQADSPNRHKTNRTQRTINKQGRFCRADRMASLTKCRPPCGVPSSKRTRNQTGSVYIHGSIFVVIVAVSYASVAKINLNLLKKKEHKVQDNWGAILQQGLWQRLLRNTINKKENIHLAKMSSAGTMLGNTRKTLRLLQCHRSWGREQCGEGLAAAFLPSLGHTRPGHWTTVFSSHWPHKSTTAIS